MFYVMLKIFFILELDVSKVFGYDNNGGRFFVFGVYN